MKQNFFRSKLFIVVAAWVLGALSACKPPPDSDVRRVEDGALDPSGIVLPLPRTKNPTAGGKRVVFSVADGADPFQRAQAFALADMVRASPGYELFTLDAKNDAVIQSEQLTAEGGKKPAIIFVAPVEPGGIGAALEMLKNGGTAVIGLDGRLTDDVCSSVVFCDDKKLGAEAGGIALQSLKRKAEAEGTGEVTGRVVQLRAREGDPSGIARADGFAAALSGSPGVVLVHDAPADVDAKGAAERIKEAARLQKSFDIIYAHNDLIAKHASEALSALGQRESVLVIGTDGVAGNDAGLSMLGRGEIDATVHRPLLVDFAWRLCMKAASDASFKPKARYEVEPAAITPKNLSEVQRQGFPLPKL